jgi:6-pyruvoyltetrahydropterin/6-carboxytetrahydropterin synthase
MIYDFGLTKRYIKELIEAFDHSITLWSGDDAKYIGDMKKHSSRWVELPVSPSAEQFSRVIFLLVEKVLNCTGMVNGERDVKLNSIIVHETDTGYAQGFKDDAYSELMGRIELKDIIFSEQIQREWSDKNLWNLLLKNKILINPSKI